MMIQYPYANITQRSPLKRKSLAISLAVLVSWTSMIPLSAEERTPIVTPAFKDLSIPAEGFMMQQLEDDPKLSVSPVANEAKPQTALKGAITTLKVTKGRSQIIKFAQSISRVSIADPTLAELIPLSPDQMMINGRQRGVTSLIVWDENGQEGIFDLYVQNDTSELLDAVRAIAPNEKIEVRVTDDSFIVSGQVTNSIILDEIRKTAAAYGYRDTNFVDLTETPVPQVVLEVRIAQANRSVTQDLKTSIASNSHDLNLTRLATPIDSTILSNRGRATNGFIPFQPIARNMGNSTNIGGLLGAYTPGHFLKFNAAWDFLETSGKITTLAEPSLVCTHGRTADFLAGGEFPYTSGVDQNGSPILSFREFGVKLRFTPWISMKTQRIELRVAPEVSSIDRSNCVTTAGGQVCGLLRRTASTTVELKDGETLMISGILTRDEQNTFAKVPFIGNVPILGAFFKNANMQKSDQELIIVVTPRIVKQGDYGKILGGPS